MVEFISRNLRIEPLRPYIIDYSLISKDTLEYNPRYGYVQKVPVDTLESHYFPDFVVAFMNPETRRIGMPWVVPYNSRLHVLRHEEGHVDTEDNKGMHDERALNDMAAYELANKTGTDKFPFPSY